MTMTNEEICREYRTAKAPLKQIQILAELNACTKKEIVKILSDAGEQLPGNYIKKPKQDAQPAKISDSGERTQFASGAVRDMSEGKGRMDLIPWCAILRLSKHYEAGAKKYAERNWEKGIPAHSFLDSAFRHLAKYADGATDEDHLIAAVWNLCGLAWTEEKRPDLMDIPARRDNCDET